MSQHHVFSYRHADELRAHAETMNLHLPWSDDLSCLHGSVRVGDKTSPTCFAALPVEGRDANADGTPGELTFRRYRRYAAGGTGLIHFEAAAFSPQGRASDHQLLLNAHTAPAIKKLLEATKAEAHKAFRHTPLCYIQLQESGRYTHATGALPRILYPQPEFDRLAHIDPALPPLTDAELATICEQFVAAARLAYEIGFDGVDVKACHRYLVSELLGARRRAGRYGGSYENRVRMVLDMMDGVRSHVPDTGFQMVSRLNLYDAVSGPDGWGVVQTQNTDTLMPAPDLAEPLQLLGQMRERGLAYVATSCGTPYGRAWVNRPYDRNIAGSALAPEHPLEGVCRGMELTRQAQKAYPDVAMSGFGYSWLREFIPNIAAGIIKEGGATLVGLGRELLAYPDMPADILRKGGVDKTQVCVTCSMCSEVMSRGGLAGCYVRDREAYGAVFKAYKAGTILRP